MEFAEKRIYTRLALCLVSAGMKTIQSVIENSPELDKQEVANQAIRLEEMLNSVDEIKDEKELLELIVKEMNVAFYNEPTPVEFEEVY